MTVAVVASLKALAKGISERPGLKESGSAPKAISRRCRLTTELIGNHTTSESRQDSRSIRSTEQNPNQSWTVVDCSPRQSNVSRSTPTQSTLTDRSWVRLLNRPTISGKVRFSLRRCKMTNLSSKKPINSGKIYHFTYRYQIIDLFKSK